MQKVIFRQSIIFILIAFFTISFLAFAADQERVRFQGKVMELSSKKEKMMIVSERTIAWNEGTEFYNHKGISIPVENIKKGNWVYIDSVNDKKIRRITAKKIYLLPKYIDKKERYLYPFMKED
jgi:hypothetical protein